MDNQTIIFFRPNIEHFTDSSVSQFDEVLNYFSFFFLFLLVFWIYNFKQNFASFLNCFSPFITSSTFLQKQCFQTSLYTDTIIEYCIPTFDWCFKIIFNFLQVYKFHYYFKQIIYIFPLKCSLLPSLSFFFQLSDMYPHYPSTHRSSHEPLRNTFQICFKIKCYKK